MAVEAILLVGGLGTRLRPLTLECPKPMLPVAGVPFVVHQLLKARDAGARRIVLATSYRPDVFAALGDGSDLGIELVHVHETDPLGTGGGIRNAASALTCAPADPVVVLNGDVLSGHDLAAQLTAHEATEAAVTLHLVEVEDPRAFGSVPTEASGRVTAFLEKSEDPPTRQVNAGCYVFRRSVIDAIPTGRPVSVERETFPDLLASGAPVQAYVDSSYWLDLGTPAAYVQGSADLVTGVLPSSAVTRSDGMALVDPSASVGDGAVVDGGSVLGAGCVVGAGAVVSGSVLQDGAGVSAGSRVVASALGPGASVGARSRLEGVVVGARSVVGADCELAPGSRVWADVVLPDKAVRLSSDA